MIAQSLPERSCEDVYQRVAVYHPNCFHDDIFLKSDLASETA